MKGSLPVDQEIAALNERLLQLEKIVKIPASVAPPKPLRWTQLTHHFYVMRYTDGVPDVGGRKPCWNMPMALVEAEKLAKLLGRIVKRVPWTRTVGEVMDPPEWKDLSWQEKTANRKGHSAVLIVEECEADGGTIRSWPFENSKPSWMLDEEEAV